MKRYIEFIKTHRKQLLVLFVVLNITALIGIFRININPDYQAFMAEKSTYKEILDEMNAVFSGSQQLTVLLETDSQDMNIKSVNEFKDVQQHLADMENVMSVSGPVPGQVISGSSMIDTSDLSDDDLQALKDYYTRLGSVSPITAKGENLYATFQVFPKEGFTNADINSIESFLKDMGLKYYISGDIYMEQKIFDYIIRILLMIPPAALLLILTVFRFQMGSAKATILSVMPAGIGALWTMGLIGWIGNQVSIITVLAPVFTIVIGSADALHFISHVQDEERNGSDRTESLTQTLRMIGIPIIITTITSMAGFLSLIVMNNSSIKELALFASLGILLAGVATWYVLPLILTGGISIKSSAHKSSDMISGYIKKLWGAPSAVILVALIVISIFGLQRISTEFNLLTVYKHNTEVYKSFDKITEVTGGGVPVFIYAKTEKNPLDKTYATRILDLESKLTANDSVGKVMSAYDLYSVINASMSGSSEPEYPANAFRIAMISTAVSNMENNPLTNLLNLKEKATRIMVFPVDMKNKTLDEINKIIEDFNRDNQDIKIRVTGIQYLMRELNHGMLQNQKNTLLLAFILIFSLLLLSLRRVKPALISLLPITVTILVLYGFLGMTGISLNLITSTIFGITIGVGIDYAIHFVSVWMSFRRDGLEPSDAVDKAYEYAARPILANAFGLAIGLSALFLSPLKIHMFVAEMMWVAMTAGVFLSLSVLPTILRRMR